MLALGYGHAARRELRVTRRQDSDAGRDNGKGQVSDSSNEPLIGATVRVKGHSDGVMTDIDGKFSISAPANGTIVVTYVGMTTREIPVNGRQKIDITLDNNAVNLDDVVVIGYGTQSEPQ